jgi:hypothetical protein
MTIVLHWGQKTDIYETRAPSVVAFSSRKRETQLPYSQTSLTKLCALEGGSGSAFEGDSSFVLLLVATTMP